VESGVIVINGRARVVHARVVEETEVSVGLYAMPELCSHLIATTFAIRAPYGQVWQADDHHASGGVPTYPTSIVWPLFSHTNNRRAVTLLHHFPNMEGILPTTKRSDLLFMPRDPAEAGRATQVAFAEQRIHVRTCTHN
jgi:hypothetical protein